MTEPFIVVDALDELYARDQESLSKLLAKLFQLQKASSLNILTTSGFNSEITSLFPQEALTKVIRAHDEDVSRYISSRIPSLLSSRISRHPELRESILKEVLQRVDGMFLLSRLHMDALASQPSVGHIKRSLKDLPRGQSGLDQTYENALQRIASQAPEQRELAKKVLSWVYRAKRALSTGEVQHAVAVETDMKDLDRDFLPDVDFLDAICAGLVTVDKEANIVGLVHYTTREFFDRHMFLHDATPLLTQTCLTYLSFDHFSDGISDSPEELETRLCDYELFTYAATYWGKHLRDHIEIGEAKEADDSLSALAMRFLSDHELVSYAVQVLLYFDENRFVWSNIWRPYEFTVLHLVAYLGLDFMINEKVASGGQGVARDADGFTPLAWAVVNGHFAACEKLLAHLDADHINAVDNNGLTPFHYVVIWGDEDIATLLLDHGADPYLADDNTHAPLPSAMTEAGWKLWNISSRLEGLT